VPVKRSFFLLTGISTSLGHHSKVTISMDQKDDRTELKLIQTGIPEEDFERTKEGWKQFYWGNMKRTFCWGMRYF